MATHKTDAHAVIGYRNNHNYPISIRMVQGAITVESGKWLVDSENKRITDPALRRFCHADGLSPVPVSRTLPKDAPKEESNQTFGNRVAGVSYACKVCERTFTSRTECVEHELAHNK